MDFGLSSSTVTELAYELGEMLGIDVMVTIVYEKVHLRGICDALLEDIAGLPANTPVVAAISSADAQLSPRSTPDAVDRSALALIGVGCRLPGNANSPITFWKSLEDRQYSVIEPPANRPTNGRPSGYLSEGTIAEFDALRFNISAREAGVMDPQQRLLLEVTHHALEDGGVLCEELAGRGRYVGVFVGISAVDYGALAMEQCQAKVAEPTAYSGTGWSISIAANRISYVYDFLGPSYSMDTACSSSLVAMDTAVNSIRRQQCSMAIVAAVNLQFRPVWSDAFSTAGMLSPTFKCKFGDDSADGYVRGEGCAAVLLKRHDAAKEDANGIYGLVVDTAVNQDGHSSGLTAPTPASQLALLTEAYSAFAKEDVAHIEAHGTGTRLGDPIELTALHRSLRPVGSDAPTLMLASVKSNTGHLECAAGINALVKTALVMSHGVLMPSLHFKTPNTHVRWEDWKLAVVTEPLDATAGGVASKLFGCSGFGFGGTNAHTVLQQIEPEQYASVATIAAGTFCVIPLSSHTQQSVQATAKLFGQYAETVRGTVRIEDVSQRAAMHQGHTNSRPARAAIIADSMESMGSLMRQLAEQRPERTKRPDGIVSGTVLGRQPRLVLVFTGQGSQYPEMGKELYRKSRAFKAAMDECDRLLRTEADERLSKRGLVHMLYAEPASAQIEALGDASFLQPALFSVEYAIAQIFLQEVLPTSANNLVGCMGHSLGEITAACVSGLLTLGDALKLAAGRGSALMVVPRGSGAMAACRASLEQVQAVLATEAPDAEIAAVNGPTGVVVSGSVAAVDRAVDGLEKNKITVRKLNVSHGFHSAEIEPALGALRAIASTLQPVQPADDSIATVSNVTGSLMEIAPDAEYWVNHARGSVQFMRGVETAIKVLKCDVMLEIGPQPHLSPHIERVAATLRKAGEKADCVVIRTLRLGKNEILQTLIAIGSLFVAGVPIDWPKVFGSGLGSSEGAAPVVPRNIRLPATALVGQRHWHLKDVDVIRPMMSRVRSKADLLRSEASDQLLFT